MKNRVLIFGGSGLVGSQFIKGFSQSFEIEAPSASQVDILNLDSLSRNIKSFSPDVVLNFAAYTNVEKAEEEKGDKSGMVYQVNAIGARNVAWACKKQNKHLIHISTEYVFDGTKEDGPYKEEDIPGPINWYGQTKYFGEQFVLDSGCLYTLVRISMPYSSHYAQKSDVARFFLTKLKNGQEITAITDQKITPTLTDNIAKALAKIIDKMSKGTYHVAVKNSTTPYGFATILAQTFNLNASLIKPISFNEYNKKKSAKLLQFSWLSPSFFEKEFGEDILHTIEEEVRLFKSQIDSQGGFS